MLKVFECEAGSPAPRWRRLRVLTVLTERPVQTERAAERGTGAGPPAGGAPPSVRASRNACSCVCWRAGVPLVPLVRSPQGRGVPRGGKASCTQEGRLQPCSSPRDRNCWTIR